MKTITVLIAPDGQTQITAEGFSGSECRSATSVFQDALGQPVQERLTAEYYNSAAVAPLQQENRQ